MSASAAECLHRRLDPFRYNPDRMPSRVDQSLLSLALDAFIEGFCYTRSFTHPYRAERVGPVRVMRDSPPKKRDARVEEWVACGIPPAELDRIARAESAGRFAISLIVPGDGSDADVRADYKSLGYRLGRTEPLMVHDLVRVPAFDAPADIRRASDQATADRLNKAARSRQILPEHLGCDTPLRQYVALIDGAPVGWVRSIVAGNGTWCSNMFVEPKHRRRGIARAMLSRMLKDDRKFGSSLAVLLASHSGAKLYPVVGYRQIGTLLLYTPTRR